MKDSGLKEILRPFRKTQFDLTPEGFVSEKVYRMSAVGDLMKGKHLEVSKDRLYEHVDDLIFGADCSFAQLESTLSPKPPVDFVEALKTGGTPQINLTPEEFQTLIQHKSKKYDVLQFANNHIMDCGVEGVEKNIEELNKAGIPYVGVYAGEEASKQVTTTMLDGIKIGWVSHTFSVNGKPVPEDKSWIVNITPFHVVANPDTSRIKQQITAAKAAGCDLVIAALHFGMEWEMYPQPQQLAWAHKFAEVGADLVIGTHPHVIQPAEIYHPESDPDKSVPMLYSLGNFTGAMACPYTALSTVANLSIAKGRLNGVERTMITGLQLTPVVCMAEEDEGGKLNAAVYPLTDLNKRDLDPKAHEYVRKVNKYADIVLGRSWRTEERDGIHHSWFATKFGDEKPSSQTSPGQGGK